MQAYSQKALRLFWPQDFDTGLKMCDLEQLEYSNEAESSTDAKW